MYDLTEANADELIKICCGLHIQAIRREGFNENGELWQLWKRLSDTLTDMGLLEADEEPEGEAEDDESDYYFFAEVDRQVEEAALNG